MSSGSPQPLLSSATAVLLRLGNSSPQGSCQQQGVPELFLLQALANPTGQQFNSTSDLLSQQVSSSTCSTFTAAHHEAPQTMLSEMWVPSTRLEESSHHCHQM
ncbi:unnamed protein product [Arctogadus glacialis]